MISSFIRIAVRTFFKRKAFFLINLLGLSVGLAAFLALVLFAAEEESYDQFHKHKNSVYRIKASRYHQNVLSREMVDVCLAAGPDLKEQFPEVENYVQMVKVVSVIRYEGEWFKTEKAGYASEDFFKVFSFRLLKGNPEEVLSKPLRAVVSETFAKRVFGDADPIGKVVNYKGRTNYEITGVFADMPPNSHMDLELILSFESYKLLLSKFALEEPWRWDGFVTYIKLNAGASANALEEKLPALIEAKTGEWLRNTNQQLIFNLQPLTSIHLHSNYNGEWKINGDAKLVLYLKIIAGAILLLAWINYISMATAQSLERAREVGVRKVMGGYRAQVIWQLLTESFLLNLIAFIIAFLWLYLAMRNWPEDFPAVDALLTLSISQWIFLVIALLGGGVMAGFYPAVVISGFDPAKAIKGSYSKSLQGVGVRRILVALQFVLSLVLLIWIFAIGKQVSLIRNQPLGINLESKLVIRDSEVYDSTYARAVAAFKSEVVRLPHIEAQVYIETLPGEIIRPYANSVRRIKADTADVNSFSYERSDEGLTSVLELSILAGQGFTETSVPRKEVLVNESAAALLGFTAWDEAINEQLYFRDDTVQIVGVLKDFYFHSPKDPVKPLIFQFDPSAGYYYVLAVSGGNRQEVVRSVESLFDEIFAGQPFQYKWLDEHFKQQYKRDDRFERALLFFSGLSVWITCLGLLGMSAYTVALRKKEIAIRKVMGSTSAGVVTFLLREYVVMVLIASTIAIPVSWFVVDSWLENFTIRITLSVDMFVVPSLLLLAITLITVGTQTFRAAMANPTESIRYE